MAWARFKRPQAKKARSAKSVVGSCDLSTLHVYTPTHPHAHRSATCVYPPSPSVYPHAPSWRTSSTDWYPLAPCLPPSPATWAASPRIRIERAGPGSSSGRVTVGEGMGGQRSSTLYVCLFRRLQRKFEDPLEALNSSRGGPQRLQSSRLSSHLRFRRQPEATGPCRSPKPRLTNTLDGMLRLHRGFPSATNRHPTRRDS